MIVKPVQDRRYQRTQAAIHTAFACLVESRGFSALTVKDIADRARINRSTFYLHYRDKHHLLEQSEAQLIKDLANILLQSRSLDLEDFTSIDQPLPALVALCDYLKANAALVRAIFTLKGDAGFQSRLRKAVQESLKLGVWSESKSVRFLVPQDYLITYVLSAHLGVVQAWLEGGCKETPQELALILSRLSINGPMHAFEICTVAGNKN